MIQQLYITNGITETVHNGTINQLFYSQEDYLFY